MNLLEQRQNFDEAVLNGDLNCQTLGTLHLYNYSRQYQYAHNSHLNPGVEEWSHFMLASRGLIIDWDNDEIVALPVSKFFNWTEGGRTTTANIVSVSTKMDGSCGILYRYQNQHRINTRGSFSSDQALWATDFLNNNGYNLDLIPDSLTLVFEIIYPENRIVIDYGDTQDLVLLLARNRHDGTELNRQELVSLATNVGFSLVDEVTTSDIEELIAESLTLTSNEEGWVILFEDGQRFKVKGEQYCELHKVISDFTFKRVAQSWVDKLDYRSEIPEEFHPEFDAWIIQLNDALQVAQDTLDTYLELSPMDSDRKTFALWVQAHVESEFSSFMFQHYTNFFSEVKFRNMVVSNLS